MEYAAKTVVLRSLLKFFLRWSAIARVFDIIGDVHGHFDALSSLLTELGYRKRAGAWRYPAGRRRAIFVGDYLDRGPRIPDTVDLVRAMQEADSAVAILGNHEYNALAWHMLDGADRPLRTHTAARRRQHGETLRQYGIEGDPPPERFRAVLGWIRHLPLFYEDESVRVVHAVWDRTYLDASPRLAPLADRRFLHASAIPGSRENAIVERILKGIEIPLPAGHRYTDKDGTVRRSTRVRWWLDPTPLATVTDGRVPLRSIAMPPVDTELGATTVAIGELTRIPGYTADRPVFFGHYWLTGRPRPFADRVACVDYGVAAGGALCAYRFDGEQRLTADNYICVDAAGRRRG